MPHIWKQSPCIPTGSILCSSPTGLCPKMVTIELKPVGPDTKLDRDRRAWVLWGRLFRGLHLAGDGASNGLACCVHTAHGVQCDIGIHGEDGGAALLYVRWALGLWNGQGWRESLGWGHGDIELESHPGFSLSFHQMVGSGCKGLSKPPPLVTCSDHEPAIVWCH